MLRQATVSIQETDYELLCYFAKDQDAAVNITR